MSSRREIVNSAIIFIGRERITSLEDDRIEVQAALDLLPKAINNCLMEDLWEQGVKYIELVQTAPSNDVIRAGYTRFELPAEFLGVVTIWREGGGDQKNEVQNYSVRGGDLLIKTGILPEDGVAPETYTLEFTYSKREGLGSQFELYCAWILADMLALAHAPSIDYAARVTSNAEAAKLRITAQQTTQKSETSTNGLYVSRHY